MGNTMIGLSYNKELKFNMEANKLNVGIIQKQVAYIT